MLSKLLAHPLTKNLDIDDPNTTLLRKKIIESKPFLKKIYQEWYDEIASAIKGANKVLEIGSGAGFFKEHFPKVITSEVFSVDGVEMIVDARKLPFANNSLDAIVMTDVFHHIPEVELFLKEANRALKEGGKIVMIEPWNSCWSKFIYSNLHHEPFIVDSTWNIPQSGPLSGANGALPWIIFERDKKSFNEKFPQLEIKTLKNMMPFCYLISGGVSTKNLIPGFLYKVIRFFEKLIFRQNFAMFAFIEIVKK